MDEAKAMKVLTLHQPYATLIALGIKTVETRGQAFRSLVGQRIAIHAAERQPVSIYSAGLIADHVTGDRWELIDTQDETYALPLGAIVCTAVVADSLPMVDLFDGHPETGAIVLRDPDVASMYRAGATVDEVVGIRDQLPYGDFRPGRYGLLLADVRPLAEPVPFKGGQGLSRSVDPALLGAV
jgi:hypothetical protein